MSVDWVMLVVLLLAVAVGFALGYRSNKKRSLPERAQTFDQRCVSGLNHLLQDRSDEAVATLVDALEVTSETLDTHLALGALLRRKGEVAQAISVHQQLLAVSGLPLIQRHLVQLELALNYVAAGLFDRAEALLLELERDSDPELRARCLSVLVDVYQSEREWRKAIGVLERMPTKLLSRPSLDGRQLKSQFCCELAEEARVQGDWRHFRSLLDEAVAYDKLGLRANWMLADYEVSQGRTEVAVKTIRRLLVADASLLPMLSGLLVGCYRSLGRPLKLKGYLQQLLESRLGGEAFVLALADDIELADGALAARDFLVWQLQRGAGVAVVVRLLSLVGVDVSREVVAESVSVLQSVRAGADTYRCVKCGFSGGEHHWHCPRCKSWSSFSFISSPVSS